MVARQRSFSGGEIVVELSAGARSDDWNHPFGPDPGDSDAARVRTRFFCDGLQHVDDGGLLRRVLRVKQPAAHSGLATGLALAVLASEDAAAERRSGDGRETKGGGHRQQFALRRALHEAVLDLKC
jgi:hypothetical protein